MKTHHFFKLITAVIVCELVGIISGLLTASAIPNWYSTLTKPALNPPSWVFGPVWTALYALMGIAAFFVLEKGWERRGVREALYVFGLQLALNATWSIVFFRFQSPGWALLNIALLELAIISTMILFYKISKPAMWLLLPYILWVSFASYLNYSLYVLN